MPRPCGPDANADERAQSASFQHPVCPPTQLGSRVKAARGRTPCPARRHAPGTAAQAQFVHRAGVHRRAVGGDQGQHAGPGRAGAALPKRLLRSGARTGSCTTSKRRKTGLRCLMKCCACCVQAASLAWPTSMVSTSTGHICSFGALPSFRSRTAGSSLASWARSVVAASDRRPCWLSVREVLSRARPANVRPSRWPRSSPRPPVIKTERFRQVQVRSVAELRRWPEAAIREQRLPNSRSSGEPPARAPSAGQTRGVQSQLCPE